MLQKAKGTKRLKLCRLFVAHCFKVVRLLLCSFLCVLCGAHYVVAHCHAVIRVFRLVARVLLCDYYGVFMYSFLEQTALTLLGCHDVAI